jgi:hypothetical protein
MSGARRDGGAMTMYLPNTDIRPTGCEAAEFIEPPTVAPAADPFPGTTEVDDGDDEPVQMRVP